MCICWDGVNNLMSDSEIDLKIYNGTNGNEVELTVSLNAT